MNNTLKYIEYKNNDIYCTLLINILIILIKPKVSFLFSMNKWFSFSFKFVSSIQTVWNVKKFVIFTFT